MNTRRNAQSPESRVHPTYKMHYRVGNWRAYERRVENAVICYKSIIGDGLRARSVSGRDVEASLACRDFEPDDRAWQA